MTDNANIHSVHVDWFAFTVGGYSGGAFKFAATSHLENVLRVLMPTMFDYLFVDSTWSDAKNRRPYAEAMVSDTGIYVQWGKIDNVYVELQAKACVSLQREKLLLPVIAALANRATRIDFAMDYNIESGMNADTVRAQFKDGMTRSKSTIVSDTGTTHYIGSMKSERYCRVYEYNKPHDRAGMPRIEFVCRRENAKIASAHMCAYGINEATQMLLNSYNFEGDGVANMVEKMPTKHVERTHAKTLNWMKKTVAGSFKKLVNLGVIEDPVAFLEEYFLSDDTPIQERLLVMNKKYKVVSTYGYDRPTESVLVMESVMSLLAQYVEFDGKIAVRASTIVSELDSSKNTIHSAIVALHHMQMLYMFLASPDEGGRPELFVSPSPVEFAEFNDNIVA